MAKKTDKLAEQTQKSLQTLTDRVDSVGKNAEGLIADGRATLKRFNDTLGRGDEVLTNLQQASKPLAERAPAITKNIEEGSARFNEVANNMAGLTKTLAQPDSALRRFVSDPTFYANVNEAAANLNKAMRQLDRITRDVGVFADKIARHPELLGIGGAVNPSSGLKEAPAGFRPNH
jgi:phospholipid/cholesterol/gamma-HCH transport system substrate-binding protein